MRNNAIIASMSISVSVAASGQLLNISVLKRTICRFKNRETGLPDNPKSLSDLLIPEFYQLLMKNHFIA
jgi:hypothetical protein